MKNKKSSAKRTVLVVLCVILAVILTALIVATIYMENLFGLINKTDPNSTQSYMSEEEYMQGEENNEDITGPEEDPNSVEWGEVDPIVASKDIINILLIGKDQRKSGNARSDAMILCTINKSAKTITMTSFLRDMYVQIPGKSDNRINASYAMGGAKLLNKTIEKNFGVTVDGNVEIDFFGFKDVIDYLGGVDIELTKAEAEYLNRRGNWDLEKNAGQWNLKEGVNHLNGSQTVAYSRIRKVGNGDFGRTNRQRTVLSKLMEMAKDMNITQVNGLLNKALPLLTTDLTDREIMSYVMVLFPMLGELQVQTQQIPAKGAYRMSMVNKMSVLIPNLKKNQEVLKEIMKAE